MSNPLMDSFWQHYRWDLSLATGAGIIAMVFAGKMLASLVPTLKQAGQLNADVFKAKMERPSYAANQRWNRKWSVGFLLVIFGMIVPFSVTLDIKPWWAMLLDMVIILMVYDFFYYLAHRFLFHDSAFLGGPLKWMHAVHHRQHNPCRWDSSYIHPLEVAIGLGLYVATIFALSWVMGRFHVATVVITWFAFTEINLHNHDRWEVRRFPFGYLNTMSEMHHHHHAKFTGGNFATITLLYDWMFGTLDHGEGGKTRKQTAKAAESAV